MESNRVITRDQAISLITNTFVNFSTVLKYLYDITKYKSSIEADKIKEICTNYIGMFGIGFEIYALSDADKGYLVYRAMEPKLRISGIHELNDMLSECKKLAIAYNLSVLKDLNGNLIIAEPERGDEIPLSAWEKYTTRDVLDIRSVGGIPPIPYTIPLEESYLVRIATSLSAPYNSKLSFDDVSPRDEKDIPRRERRRVEPLARSDKLDAINSVLSFIESFNERAPDGSFKGDTVLAYQKDKRSGPVTAWVLRFTMSNLARGGKPEFSPFPKNEARTFLNDLRLSTKQKDKEAYEKVLALFN